MLVKICGLNQPENIKSILSLQPGMTGFIFYKKSPRCFQLPDLSFADFGKTKKTGVFVNESEEVILQTVRKFKLDFVQLHGDENPGFCKRIKDSGTGIIKAFPVSSAFRFESTIPFLGSCDFFLFDTRSEKKGGSGKKFSWSYLKHYHNRLPFFLSGGIAPGDAARINELAQEDLNIAGVDLNSRFETAPGIKNVELVKEFINELRVFDSSVLKNNF